MVDTSAQKAALRRALLDARGALEPQRKAQFDALICARVVAWWEANLGPGEVLGVYWPLRGEPDLAAAYAALAARGAALALPVVLARDSALGFAAWTPGEALLRDTMGVAVPAARRMLARPPALLIPCLGFNAGRFRLGYGGGYYDRTLAAPPRPRTVGIAYQCLAADFASAPHDVALDLVLTEA
ncbi:MAG TPA: 5-formyltetrahydrofolate cyclo-ligase [Telluria sp.]|jgi:5,10-methenyltetrahydrofolate synthetase